MAPRALPPSSNCLWAQCTTTSPPPATLSRSPPSLSELQLASPHLVIVRGSLFLLPFTMHPNLLILIADSRTPQSHHRALCHASASTTRGRRQTPHSASLLSHLLFPLHQHPSSHSRPSHLGPPIRLYPATSFPSASQCQTTIQTAKTFIPAHSLHPTPYNPP